MPRGEFMSLPGGHMFPLERPRETAELLKACSIAGRGRPRAFGMILQVEEVRISLPHIELAAHLFGPPDGKPVIALHGWLDNAMSFSRLAPKLAGLRIVALDFAGHGHSAHRAEGASYLLWDYALDVLMVAEQLGWERFSLLGHSMGAIVSVLLAGALPERIERLALIDGLITLAKPTRRRRSSAKR